MQKSLKIVLIAFTGFFFSIATLEIDAFGYDNIFFDTYDAYVHVDYQGLHDDSVIDDNSCTYSEAQQPIIYPSIISVSSYEESFSSVRLYSRKLYLTQSSLLI